MVQLFPIELKIRTSGKILVLRNEGKFQVNIHFNFSTIIYLLSLFLYPFSRLFLSLGKHFVKAAALENVKQRFDSSKARFKSNFVKAAALANVKQRFDSSKGRSKPNRTKG